MASFTHLHDDDDDDNGGDVDVNNVDSIPGMYVVKPVLSGQSRPSLVPS